MSNTGNKLKTLIDSYVGSTRPTDFYFATMVTPTQIQLDSSQGAIPEQLVIIPEHLKTFKVLTRRDESQEWTPLEVDNSLKTGDRVIVLQKPGGQKYLILGRL